MKARVATEWDEMRRDIARAPGWLREYGPGNAPTLIAAFEALIALEDPTPDAARACFLQANPGSDRRYLQHCDGCGESVRALVEVGQEPDYESATASLCPACVTEAYDLMRATMAADEVKT